VSAGVGRLPAGRGRGCGSGPGGITAEPASARPAADLTLATDPDTTIALLAGRLRPDHLDPDRRPQVRGTDDALRRFTALTDRARNAREAHENDPEHAAS